MSNDVFYAINFSFSIFVSVAGSFCCMVIIAIIIINQPCRTISNFLLVNTCVATLASYINTYIVSIYGFREDWARNQPLCVFRAYTFMASGSAICYSFLGQAISRFFFVVLFKHKILLTDRVHCYMVALIWVISFVAPVPPLLIKDGYAYDITHRLCLPSLNQLPMTTSILVIGFVIPLTLSIVFYYKIWRRTMQSSRRLVPTAPESTTGSQPNMKRERKLARNMTILLSTYGLAGTPLSIVLFWRMFNPNSPPPEALYLLASNAISLFVGLMTVAMFVMSKQLKDIGLAYVRRAWGCMNA